MQPSGLQMAFTGEKMLAMRRDTPVPPDEDEPPVEDPPEHRHDDDAPVREPDRDEPVRLGSARDQIRRPEGQSSFV